MEQAEQLTGSAALLASIALDLRLPLLQIQTKIESLDNSRVNAKDISALFQSSRSGLMLLEAYLMALNLERQATLPLEPIAIGALLDEAAHAANGYAAQYGTDLVVDPKGKLGPVLAHKKSAQLALSCLAQSMVRAQAAQQLPTGRHLLVLGAHRFGTKIIAGVYGSVEGLSGQMLRSARRLAGTSQQPHAALTAHSGSGILIAETLCSVAAEPLRVSRHNHYNGIATVFGISNQLQLL